MKYTSLSREEGVAVNFKFSLHGPPRYLCGLRIKKTDGNHRCSTNMRHTAASHANQSKFLIFDVKSTADCSAAGLMG